MIALAGRYPWGTAFVSALVTTVVGFLLNGAGASAPIAVLILCLCVVVAAALGVRVVGIVTALVAAVGYDFFLTDPRFTFSISKPDDVAVTGLLAAIGLLVNEVALWATRNAARSERASVNLETLLTSSELQQSDTSDEEFVAHVLGEITRLLGADDARLVTSPPDTEVTAVLHADGSVTSQGTTLDVERSGLPTDRQLLVPVDDHHDVALAATGTVSRPPAAQRRIAAALARHLASRTS